MRQQFLTTVAVFSLLCLPCRIIAQAADTIMPYYDTSAYIPSFYEGALNYDLMIAASEGYDLEIKRLITLGADINTEAENGATPLVFAVSNNRNSTVKALLEFGSDLDKVTRSYETPLIIAVKNRNFEITETLIRAGADIDLTDKYGATPLHHASVNGYLDIVDLLLYYDANINERTDEGNTPLLASIWAGYPEVADLLIQNGANLEVSDNDGYTPFLMATLSGDTILMDLLYKKGADIFAINKTRYNALTLSILSGKIYVTSYLFRMSDKWAKSVEETVNPYSVATKYRRRGVFDILKKNNVPGQVKYGFDQVAITLSERVSFHDIYTGVSLTFKEPYLDLGIIAGCDMKLWYSRLLVKNSEHLFYQFMDKGSVVYTGLFKDFALTDHLDRYNLALSTSLLAGYSFGNKLKGTLLTPENKFMAIPSVSLKIVKMNLTFSAGVEYIKTEFYHNGPVWVRVGCSYNYFFDNVRTSVKPLKWY